MASQYGSYPTPGTALHNGFNKNDPLGVVQYGAVYQLKIFQLMIIKQIPIRTGLK